jgi:hypothetical protein
MTENPLPRAMLPIVLASAGAHAHEGHGLPGGSHWHAGDMALLLAGVVLVVWAVASRKKP